MEFTIDIAFITSRNYIDTPTDYYATTILQVYVSQCVPNQRFEPYSPQNPFPIPSYSSSI